MWSREVVDAPCLEVFNTRLDGTLSDLVGEVSLPMAVRSEINLTYKVANLYQDSDFISDPP